MRNQRDNKKGAKMKNYHEKKIKTAIDLLGFLMLLIFSILIAFLLINLFEFLNLDWFFSE
jgi:hypothetical protein